MSIHPEANEYQSHLGQRQGEKKAVVMVLSSRTNRRKVYANLHVCIYMYVI